MTVKNHIPKREILALIDTLIWKEVRFRIFLFGKSINFDVQRPNKVDEIIA